MAIKFESFRGTGGAVTGGLVYKGPYNATAQTPDLTTSLKGDFYIVDVEGTLAGVQLNVGDHIVFNQNASSPITSAMFDVIDNTDAVASVNGQTGVVSLGASDVNALAIANNLSDLNNAGTARTNLGLGTSATLDTGTSNGNVVVLDATGLPAVDGSQLTGITATDNTKLAIANNLSDLNNVATARTNLGLGTSATLDTGTSNGNVVVLDATGLPAVDGSQLTGITATDSTKLAIANNLSDLNNVATARTNLGLGTSATLDSGTANGNVVVLDATGLPAVDGSQLTGITATDSTKLAIANNLSDLNNVATARTNLGLGTSATLDVGTSANNVVQLDGSSRLPAVDGSQLTNISPTGALLITNNLSDLNNTGTARTNLGLGTSATLDTGTASGNVVVLDATGLPAVDGSQLTNITATDSTKLAIANNLSDLNNAGTARTNLGLGTSATLDTGTSNGNVVVLDATGLPAVDGSQLTGITATDSTKLAIANNLSDLNSASTARTNLGLGTSATLDSGTSNGNVVVLDATGLPAVDGSQLTNVTATDSTKLAIANNLSDLNNVATARTNLGLGTSSTLDVGTSANNVVQLDGSSRLPAVDGSQLTNITATDSTKLAIANNLSDLNNAGTARTNLGLGTSATLDTGTANGNVVVLDATGLPAVDGSQLTGIQPGVMTYTSIATGDSPVTGALATHYSADTSGGAITINLPALAGGNAGKEIRVKLKTAGNTLTLDGNSSETIDGSTTYTLTVQNQAVTLVSDGSSNWEVI